MHVGGGRHTRERNLRARDSMSYLQFVRLVTNLWGQAHPDVPIIPTGGSQDADYPCILYGLELRQTHRSDPKMRLREVINDEGEAYVVSGQRFQNVVSFTAVTESDPVLCEEIIETFEDFMLEMTPVLKEAGASELVYSRRYADDEDSRAGQGVVKRKVAYLLTTERVASEKTSKLEAIIANISVMGDEVYTHEGSTLYNDVTPRYYTVGPGLPVFKQTGDDALNDLITVPRSGFVIGDRVYLSPNYNAQDHFPPGIDPGFYIIGQVVGNPYHADVKYGLSDDDGNPISFGGATPSTGEQWVGDIRYIPEYDVTINIIEQATPHS